MDYLFLLAVILFFAFFITVAFVYIVRPNFLIVVCEDTEIVEEIDMWRTFLFSMAVALVVVAVFTAIYGNWIKNQCAQGISPPDLVKIID